MKIIGYDIKFDMLHDLADECENIYFVFLDVMIEKYTN
jgi:hypothetical protein